MGKMDDDQASATKGDIKSVRRDLALGSVRTDARIDALKEYFDVRLTDFSSKIFHKIDASISRTEKVDRAQVIVDWRLSEIEKRLAAMEPRSS